jgi:acyl carrier protein
LGVAPEGIALASTWQQLGADSLDSVELIMAFEEEFHLEISDAQAVTMKTVGDAVAFISQHAKQ